MKKLFIYNLVIFKSGGFFTKFWMITMPFFVLFLTFGDINVISNEYTSLWAQKEDAWPIILLYSLFVIAYPFRNYIEVDRIIKGAKTDMKIAHDYKSVLDLYKSLKN